METRSARVSTGLTLGCFDGDMGCYHAATFTKRTHFPNLELPSMADFYQRRGKRILDLVLTIPALILLAPVMSLVALAVWLTMGRPLLFRQLRPGLYGEPFTLRKFRTMTDERDATGNLLPNAQRLTRMGALLRSTSLDELPELWNVLRGEMSLVGPRPLLVEYLPLYTPEQARRHEANPGITGWAQVSGRNALTWEQKFALDVWYVDHRSFLLDLRILFMTVWKVCKREGIGHNGHATMVPFGGSTRS
jgi:sugar transferase EpsL